MSTPCLRLTMFFCLALGPAFAQQPAADSRQMTLDVVVTDKSGKPVPGLEQKDFTLLDNKQPQNILSFAAIAGGAAGPPIEAVVVVDEVNTRFSSVSFARAQIDKYLLQDGGKLPVPVSVAVLSDSGIALGNAATRDGNALATSLDQNKAGLRAIGRDQGVYGAGDRLGLSLNSLEQLAAYETPRPGRKLVIWISPGWPILTGPQIQLSDKDRKSIFGQVVRISDALRRAQITLYSIDPLGTADAGSSRTYYYEEFVKGVKKENQVQMGNLALQALAVQSGGRVFNSSNDVTSEIGSAIADAKTYYILTFDSLPGDGPNEYHALTVKLDQRGLTPHARTGYYAQPTQ
ncbi:MAG TPA: VWA domain-containing protein [Bryobacteraceae bacterium]|nr:VWA domain-containing protein [Bryobacteraceae bacterium]